MTSAYLRRPIRTEAEARAQAVTNTAGISASRFGDSVALTRDMGRARGVMRGEKLTALLPPNEADELADRLKASAKEARGS
jgi:hypothetical protein